MTLPRESAVGVEVVVDALMRAGTDGLECVSAVCRPSWLRSPWATKKGAYK